jgi:hypothetical protein
MRALNPSASRAMSPSRSFVKNSTHAAAPAAETYLQSLTLKYLRGSVHRTHKAQNTFHMMVPEPGKRDTRKAAKVLRTTMLTKPLASQARKPKKSLLLSATPPIR